VAIPRGLPLHAEGEYRPLAFLTSLPLIPLVVAYRRSLLGLRPPLELKTALICAGILLALGIFLISGARAPYQLV
jgi:hypothetical protein